MRNAFTHHDNADDRGFERPDRGHTDHDHHDFGRGARRGGGPFGGPGFEEAGSEHPGFERRGFDRQGFERQGFERQGFDGPGHGEGRGRRGGHGPRGGRGEHGFGPGGSPWEGRGFDGPLGARGGRGPGRGRRGDVRAAILALLGEEPMNGYGLIGAIAEKSQGLWKPGAGSIYPALGLLEDEGLIAPDVEGRRKLYALTDEGRAYVEQHADEVKAPWERVAGPHTAILDLRPELHQLGMALHQVTAAGDQAQVDAARAILERARKDVYRLLAGDLPTTSDDSGAAQD